MRTSRLARWTILSVVLILLCGAAWAFWPSGTGLSPQALALQEQMRKLRDSNTRPTAEQRAALRQQVDSLPPQEREQLFAAGRERFRKQFEDRFNEYFNAPPDQRVAVLDRHIAQMETMRRRFEQSGGGRRGTGWGGGGMGGTREERNGRRRMRLDATTPEFRAKRAEYRKAMQQRRDQLGLPSTGRRGF